MTLFRLLLPVLLGLFFLWKAYRNRIFLLGIPFLQVMGNSVFFDQLKVVLDTGEFYLSGKYSGMALYCLDGICESFDSCKT